MSFRPIELPRLAVALDVHVADLHGVVRQYLVSIMTFKASTTLAQIIAVWAEQFAPGPLAPHCQSVQFTLVEAADRNVTLRDTPKSLKPRCKAFMGWNSS